MLTKFLSLCSLFIAASLFAGPLDRAPDYPTGFSEIPWGTPPDKAKAAMLAQAGVIEKTTSDESKMEFTGGTFAGAPVESWKLYFTDSKLSKGWVHIKPARPTQVYAELKNQLAKKYRKEGRQDFGGGIHYASYFNYNVKEGRFGIVLDVNTDGIKLEYYQSPGTTLVPKDAKKQL